MTKGLIEVIEKCGWIVRETEDGLELENYSPAGEDLVIEISCADDKECAKELQDNYVQFDADEHATMWYGKNRGEPSSIRELLNDADEINDMFYELARQTNNYVDRGNMTEKQFKEYLLCNVNTINNGIVDLRDLIARGHYVEAAEITDSLCDFLKDMYSFIENERRKFK